MCHDEHCICSFLSSLVAPLCHASKIFAKCSLPYFCSCWVMHHFFVAGDCATRDWIHHCVYVVFEVERHFGMFHECTWGKDFAEYGLFVDGKYVYGLLGHNTLLCTTGKVRVPCLCPASWLHACGLFRIGQHNCWNLLNKVWGWHNPRCVVLRD